MIAEGLAVCDGHRVRRSVLMQRPAWSVVFVLLFACGFQKLPQLSGGDAPADGSGSDGSGDCTAPGHACTTGVCDTTSKNCVECIDDSTCNGATPVCSNDACTGCT